jgi:hypothetical protein
VPSTNSRAIYIAYHRSIHQITNHYPQHSVCDAGINDSETTASNERNTAAQCGQAYIIPREASASTLQTIQHRWESTGDGTGVKLCINITLTLSCFKRLSVG